MGEAGRARVVPRYRVERLVDDVDALYRELLANAGLPLPATSRRRNAGADASAAPTAAETCAPLRRTPALGGAPSRRPRRSTLSATRARCACGRTAKRRCRFRPQPSGTAAVPPRPSRSGSRTVKVVPRPASLSAATEPPIASVSCFTIARPRPVPTRLFARSGCGGRSGRRRAGGPRARCPGPVSATRSSPRRRGDRDAAARRRRADRVLDQVREHLEHAVGVGRRRRAPSDVGGERDADAARLGLVPRRPPRAASSARSTGSRRDREHALVQPRQVEQVAHEPLEPLRLGDDDARRPSAARSRRRAAPRRGRGSPTAASSARG